MSIVGTYPMPQNYGPPSMACGPGTDAFYSTYYSHPSPPTGQHFYHGWASYQAPPTGCHHEMTPTAANGHHEYSAGFMMGVGGSPPDFGAPGEYTFEMVGGRVVKRRSSANKKERRRTQSINNAFAELRDCIPNVPADTKLSKIKTLRLATSYIAYLMQVLRTDDSGVKPCLEFKAELPPKTKIAIESVKVNIEEQPSKKGRTGWPQAVWAQELKN